MRSICVDLALIAVNHTSITVKHHVLPILIPHLSTYLFYTGYSHIVNVLQINRHTKRMNKDRPTLNRISWTTVGLNFFIDLQGDIDDLRISKNERDQGFAKGTLEDAAKLTHIITNQIGVVEHRVRRAQEYEKGIWYAAIQEEPLVTNNNIPESDKLELAFSQVGDLYVKNQQMWDDAQEVVTDDESDDEEEGNVSEEDGSDMENNITM